MLKLETIDSLDSLMQIKDDWDSLFEECGISYPFLTFDWILIWWKSFKKGNLSVVVVREGNKIIAIAPFMTYRKIWRCVPLKVVSFLSNYHSNRAEILLSKDPGKVLDVILSYVYRQCDLIELGFLSDECKTSDLLKGIKKYRYLSFVDFESPYITIDGQWEDFLKGRSKKLKRKLNSLNKKYKGYNHEIVHYTKFDPECMMKIFHISKNTWKYTQNSAIVSHKDTKGFYENLAIMASDRGWLDIHILEIDYTPVAFDFKLNFNNIIYCLKIGYDMSYAKKSVGQFLMQRSIEDAFKGGCKEYDFVGKVGRFKREWTGLVRPHHKYLVFTNSICGRLLCFIEKGIIKRIKRMLNK